jgi:hypothetical protein
MAASGSEASQTDGARQKELELMKEKLHALMEEYERAGGYRPIHSNCKKLRDSEGLSQTPEMFFGNTRG